jgi:hypothetical protein
MSESKKAYGDAQALLFEEGGTFIPYLQNGSRVMTNKITGIKPLGEDYIRWHLVDKAE